ncbi:MAG: class I SAM-dependent methyltransferase [Chloroflexi bacterium]|nr:class I SAM-dependent methyltransferase [Chloroflexota bacterium]
MGERPEPSISRVTRSRKETQRSYDRISRAYDLLQGNWEKTLRRSGLRQLEAQAGERLLEIGSGPGHNLVEFSQAVGRGGRVCGLDLSWRMCALARHRLQRSGARACLACGDALRLPYPGHFFDAAFLSFTLELLDTPEIPLALAEIRRVLKPDGRIGVVSLSKAAGERWPVSLYEWGHRRFPGLLDCRPIFARRALEQAGFTPSRYELVSLWGLSVELVMAHPTG